VIVPDPYQWYHDWGDGVNALQRRPRSGALIDFACVTSAAYLHRDILDDRAGRGGRLAPNPLSGTLQRVLDCPQLNRIDEKLPE
jgi:hypothetical protein